MRIRSIATLSLLACASFPADASAQKSAPKSEPKAAPAPPRKTDATLPTRADLARAYVRFERALKSTPPPDARRKDIDTAFDKLTVAFFSGESRRAVETLNELAASLDPDHAPSAAAQLAMSLRAQLDPPMLVAGWPPRGSLEVVQMYTPAGSNPSTAPMRLVLLDPSGAECASATVPPFAGDVRSANVPLVFSRDKLDVGVYRVVLDGEARESCVIASVFMVERALDSVRRANEERMTKVETDRPKLVRALDTCRARNKLLTERPSKSESAQFLADPIRLQREVASEIQALEAGRDPYYRRAGDLWRVFRSGNALIPLRTYAPAAAAEGKPLPLVIALHGAAGDENVFFVGYGGGLLPELARERGFILASPELGFSFGDGKRFDALLQSLTRDYNIDEKKIYLLGHSMGAGVAGALASLRRDRLAGVVCFAGSPAEEKTDIVPTLVIIGELDPLSDAKATGERIEKERLSGVPIEFRLAPDQGHTLPVGRYLTDAVTWLLAHERGAKDAPLAPLAPR